MKKGEVEIVKGMKKGMEKRVVELRRMVLIIAKGIFDLYTGS